MIYKIIYWCSVLFLGLSAGTHCKDLFDSIFWSIISYGLISCFGFFCGELYCHLRGQGFFSDSQEGE